MNHQLINSKVAHYSGIVYVGEDFDSHFHNSYELVHVIKGSITVKIGVDSFELKKKEFLIISPCAVHSICSDPDAEFFIAIISSDYIPDYSGMSQNDVAVRFSLDPSSLTFIGQNLINVSKPSLYMLKSCLYLILSFAERGDVLISAKSVERSFIYTVNTYISEHFTENLTRKDLARLVGCEEHYFSTLFHKHFGMNIRKYISMYRVSHACRLLQNTNDNISSIGLDSGFSSIREFNTVFSELMGITPKEFRSNKR